MQTISDDLAALLTSHLQAGPSGFRSRVEVDIPKDSNPLLDTASNVSSGVVSTWRLPSVDPHGDNVRLVAWVQVRPNDAITPPAGWTLRAYVDNGVSVAPGQIRYALLDRLISASDNPYADVVTAAGSVYWTAAQEALRSTGGTTPQSATANGVYSHLVAAQTVTATLGAPATAGRVLIAYMSCTTGAPSGGVGRSYTWPSGWAVAEDIPALGAYIGPGEVAFKVAAGGETSISVTAESDGVTELMSLSLIIAEYEVVPDISSTTSYLGPKRIDIDQSLNMGAGQMAVEFANEGLPLGWASTSVFPTNCRIRAYQWYGDDDANAVRTFTGIIDRVGDSRDPLTTVIACRDMMAILIDQTHTATGPQGADETGAVRTEANGVYLNHEVDYIVSDILDRWGWPTADRAITATSYVLAEFIIADGESGTGAIIGADKLTGFVGYDAWADELGVFHFAPNAATSALTEPATPAYTFRTGVDIMSLSDEMTQYDLRTRVKVRGPMTTETLTDTWREEWRTDKFARPVGIWYDPADPDNIRVLDRGTKRLYKLRQADCVVLSSTYLGTVIPYPLDVSGDPADASVYWVLNCPWKYTGSTTGNSIKKVTKATNAVAASYSLPDGRWTALKVSSANLWLTNWDTDRLHKRSKADGSAVADYGHAVGGVTQTNPSGLMVDGATLHVFWSNSGTTARFLICAESAPGTVTKVITTAGTVLVGGEMDTTTHTACWGCSDSIGLVAKFTLVDVSSTTAEVFAEVVDSDLEDELGTLAQTEPRTHDTHPGDPAHPWMIRRETITLDAVISLAQATETAGRRLDKIAHRSRVLDFGILGNPAVQKTDLVRVEDPVTGIGENFLIDTHRSGMAAESTYTGTIAGIPVVSPGDVVTDDGDAT